MSLIKSNTAGLGGSGSPGGALGSFFSQTIDQSLRLDSASGAYLEIAEASPTATDRKKVTISCWVKRAGISVSGVNTVFWSSTAGLMLQFFTADSIYIYDNNASGFQAYVQPQSGVSRLFRDPAAWYHLALIIDTTQSTAADRAKFYVNGELNALSSYPGQNDQMTWHTGSTMRIGSVGDTQDLAGYIAEFISIDGQDVAISDLGETKDGVWIPKDVSGLTLGNAGFYLPFTQDRTVGASTFFSDAGNSYVEFANATHYDIGSSDDFTIECFLWPSVTGEADYSYFLGKYQGNSDSFGIQYSKSANAFYFYYNVPSFGSFGFTFSDGDFDAGRWHHLAFNRASGNLDVFLDGTRIGGNLTSNTTSWTTQSAFRIGLAQTNNSNGFDGYISNVRMVVGSAVYSSGSSITVPTSTLTAVTNTKLLALTTTTITADGSTNNVTGTVGGSGYFATDGLSPFANGAFNEDAGSNGIDFAAKNVFDYDVVLDSPTNNFPTMNDIYHSGAKGTLSSGALKVSGGGFVNTANGYGAVSTFTIPKDKKIYIEVECTDADGTYWSAGFATQSGLESGPSATTVGGSNSITVYNRQVYLNGTEIDYGGSAGLGGFGIAEMGVGEILGMAIDGATGKVWFSRNGTYFQSPSTDNSGSTGDPAAGTNEIGTISGGTTEDVFVILQAHGTINNLFINFGQDSQNVASAQSDSEGIGTFEYAPPTGYVSLCSSNLTTTDIGPTQGTQAEDHFETVLFTGNGGSNDVSSLSFQPDVTIIGPRNYTGAQNYQLYDSLRSGQRMRIDSTSGQNSGTGFSFTSDGFDIGADGLSNANTYLYCSWNFKAGGTANTFNIDGTGYASMSAAPISDGTLALASLTANTTAGFSMATFNMPDAEKTVAHGLGVKPEMIILRKYDASNHWMVWFKEMGENTSTGLRLNDGSSAATSFGGAGNWFQSVSNTLVGLGPYGSYFGLGNQIMYSFASKEGYSKIGSYEGNGAANGTFVYTGFRPAFILLRNFDAANFWFTYDNRREGFNESNDTLSWNYSSVEDSTYKLDILSNGFKIRSSQNAHNQANTFVYMAIAEAPLKFANAR